MTQLYDLVQIRRGKETLVMTDNLQKVKARMKILKASQRKGIKGDRVEYEYRPSENTDKFRRKPHTPFGENRNYNSGGQYDPPKS